MKTIENFVAENQITMRAEWSDTNPNMEEGNMDHWKCIFFRKDGTTTRQMIVYFSMGYGHKGTPPDVESVLDCLASDSASIVNADSFEDWTSELGYDEDSRRAERTYNACFKLGQKLGKFLGDNLFNELLWDTERA